MTGTYRESQTLGNQRHLLPPRTSKILIRRWGLRRKLGYNLLMPNVLIQSWHPDLFTHMLLLTQLWEYGGRVRSQLSVWRRSFLYFFYLVDYHGAVRSCAGKLGRRVCYELLQTFAALDVNSAGGGIGAEGWVVVTGGSQVFVLMVAVHRSELGDVFVLKTGVHWFELAVCPSSLCLNLSLHDMRSLSIIPCSPIPPSNLLLQTLLRTILDKTFLQCHISYTLVPLQETIWHQILLYNACLFLQLHCMHHIYKLSSQFRIFIVVLL